MSGGHRSFGFQFSAGCSLEQVSWGKGPSWKHLRVVDDMYSMYSASQ